MNKYAKLGHYLNSNSYTEVPMTFSEIERIIGDKLPPSAYRHRPWWSNNASNSVMTKVWLDAGYHTEQVDMSAKKLVFKRTAFRQPARGIEEGQRMFKPAETVAPPAVKVTRHPAIGALKGMFTIEPGYDIAQSDPEEVAEWEAAIDRKADLYEAGRTRK
jgi:hypothetical protein